MSISESSRQSPSQPDAASGKLSPAADASTSTPAAGRLTERTGWRRRIRAAGAVIAGRGAGALARRLRVGAGTSIPGLVARRIDPDVTTYLASQLRHGSVVITGTNGKTTTSGMIAAVLRGGGLRVWRNREGANLARGVTAALLIRSRPLGDLRWGGAAAAVFEVDEAAFSQVVREVQPRAVVVTNLFRDQLDRYGEVDTVTERWRTALAALPVETTLVLNADDPAVAALGLDAPAGRTVLYFGVESVDQHTPKGGVEVIDSRTCPHCGEVLAFDVRFYSHVGHWRCPRCGLARPQNVVEARDVSTHGLDGSSFVLSTPDGQTKARIGLPGLYNVYNALAAATVGRALSVTTDATVGALGRFTAAFGRAERIAVGDKTVWLLLAKNPTGLNEVLRALAVGSGNQHLLAILNDRAADGEDVSWIWDADFERMAGLAARVTAAGLRAYDLGLRLKYAQVEHVDIVPDIVQALHRALDATPAGGSLCVVPTYTALLTVRAELEREGYAAHYWEQRDV